MDEILIGDTRVTLVHGDITAQEVDAVVNAANSSLMGGGGVDGAIHRAGGPAILEACKEIVDERGALDAGGAVITTAGNLPARWVIHAVGPIWRGGGRGEPETLGSAYRESLERAREAGARTVAFPSISTGAYGYPVAAAAEVALGTVAEELRRDPGALEEVRFVLYDMHTFGAYKEALERILGK